MIDLTTPKNIEYIKQLSYENFGALTIIATAFNMLPEEFMEVVENNRDLKLAVQFGKAKRMKEFINLSVDAAVENNNMSSIKFLTQELGSFDNENFRKVELSKKAVIASGLSKDDVSLNPLSLLNLKDDNYEVEVEVMEDTIDIEDIESDSEVDKEKLEDK